MATNIGGNTTSSSPFVADGVVYFRGTNDKLFRVNPDGSNQQNIGGNKTSDSPFVALLLFSWVM
jgi:outer membrane protein assembly factor BamB